ncbi:MAG: hypothetical protein JRF37_11790, partial [Deltaproteobacteria bacterium]|nr:hypothetical protein [Deltaproteobacteria bacterium]
STDTDQVLKVIRRFKNGVGFSVIKDRTGLGDITVRNIVARVYKQGKVKRVGKGMYVGT